MKTRVVIDRAGRIAIPKSLRKEMHLEPGDALEITSSAGEMTLRPVRGTGALTEEHGIWVFYGGQPLPASATDDVLQQVRGERDLGNVGRKE